MKRWTTALALSACMITAVAHAQEEPSSPAVEEARQRFDLGMRHAE